MSTRVVHVLQTADGGGAVHAAELARHALARGGEAVLCAPGAGAELHGISAQPLPRRPGVRTAAVLRLAGGADILHVHGIRVGGWSLAALPRVPSLVTFHGLHPLRRAAGAAHRAAGAALITALAALADAVVCVSRADTRLLERLPLRAEKLHVVRNGVHVGAPPDEGERRVGRRELGLDEHTLAVLVPGRLTEAKAPLRALEVARALLDENVTVVFAGSGELEPEVRRAAPANVRVLGYRPDVRKLLAAADVVLSTALWEGLPLALLEAMAAERPVVASNADGNVEAVGDAGIVVAREDVDGFAAALLRLRDERARGELAARGRRRVAEHFALERMLAETDAVYAGVLGRAPW